MGNTKGSYNKTLHTRNKLEYINYLTIQEGTTTYCRRQGKSNNPCHWKAWLQDTKPSLATWAKLRNRRRTQLPQGSTMPKSLRTMMLHPTRIFWLRHCPIPVTVAVTAKRCLSPLCRYTCTPPATQIPPVLLKCSAGPTHEVSSKTLKWHWSRMKPATTILAFVCMLKQKEISISSWQETHHCPQNSG